MYNCNKLVIKVDHDLKLLKRCVFPALSAVFIVLCSCTKAPPDVIDGLINNNEPTFTYPSDSAQYKDYRELFLQYKECNAAYFSSTEAAINTLLGQKYVYGITAYKHSDELSEIAEMFFDDNAENTLNIYFALRGYEDKEYTQNGNTAQYGCKKNGDAYVYKASYSAESRSFDITLDVNGELKDKLSCSMTDDSLTKYCYRGTIDRTFFSRVNKDGTSRIDWYEGLVSYEDEAAQEEYGYVAFDGMILSGVIK